MILPIHRQVEKWQKITNPTLKFEAQPHLLTWIEQTNAIQLIVHFKTLQSCIYYKCIHESKGEKKETFCNQMLTWNGSRILFAFKDYPSLLFHWYTRERKNNIKVWETLKGEIFPKEGKQKGFEILVAVGLERNDDRKGEKEDRLIPSTSSFLVKYRLPCLSTPTIFRDLKKPRNLDRSFLDMILQITLNSTENTSGNGIMEWGYQVWDTRFLLDSGLTLSLGP